MTRLGRIGKLTALAFVLAVTARYVSLSLMAHGQDVLTENICDLVSLPLETGLVRQTHEGLEAALKARGEQNACVSVVDKERSYSPDCTDANTNYRMVMCKAKANTGMRAAIYYPQAPLIALPLYILWASLIVFLLIYLELSKRTASFLLATYNNELVTLLYPTETQIALTSPMQKTVSWIMERSGIAKSLALQADRFQNRIRAAEEKIHQEVLNRERLEAETLHGKRYREKVDRIHHDIRSPISSLQSIYERVSANDPRLARSLTNAIRRIQLAMEELGQIGENDSNLKLVVAEVALDETVTVMAQKFEKLKAARLTLKYDPTSLSPIRVDLAAFQATAENILENALDAIGVGGEVCVLITNRGERCEITFEDNGCGISDEAIEKLGLKNATVGKVNGTGLGLFHAKKNVEAWGGSIRGERMERGTRLSIILPLFQTGVVFSGLPDAPEFQVIDDDGLTAQVLSSSGYNVSRVANSFAEGQALLAADRAADVVVLVDQMMDHDHLGTDLIAGQVIRKNVFLCTNSFDDPQVLKKAKAVGVKVLPKPLCFSARQVRSDRF